MTPSTEIYIHATETDPAVQAQAAIRAGHHRLLAALRAKVALLAELHLGAGAREAAQVAVTEFCTGEVRRHLAASDQALYAPAAGAPETRLLIRALRTTAVTLHDRIDALSRTDDTDASAALAQSIEAVLATHLAVEETVLLPALAALPGADLPTLAADLTTLLNGGHLDQPAVINATELPHGRRHPRIFARYARLAPGEAFTLINNHDPKPLRREFEATYPGDFTWEYLETGPQRWQIRIGRTTDD
ncbi:DUF2249 domain-containing protein [Streptomyces sp. AF1A]|uniref:DUF2249 domain-containing protein n=1 Tax=Streptomyces sp. AF1A TaxID=3394350 RepID=UPI0039BCF355